MFMESVQMLYYQYHCLLLLFHKSGIYVMNVNIVSFFFLSTRCPGTAFGSETQHVIHAGHGFYPASSHFGG